MASTQTPGAFVPTARQAVLFRTHFWDEACGRNFKLLIDSLRNSYDVIATGFLGGPDRLQIPLSIPQVFHNAADLAGLPYPNLAALRPHQIEPLEFFRKYPDYETYWLVEYDVRYTGSWRELFESLGASRADMLATVVQRRLESPLWIHWREFCAHQPALAEAHYVKIFTPLMRVSNAAMRAIDAAYRAGWAGHYEVVWPSAVAAAGLAIEDIGGDGSFTPPSRRALHYTANPQDKYLAPGSFVFRPSILEQDIPPAPARLWHPVKSADRHAPQPPPEPTTWRDSPILRPLRLLRRRLRNRVSPHF